MREAVIVSAARTPIGKAYRGAYNKTAKGLMIRTAANKLNRKLGTYGNGDGLDASHTSKSKGKLEKPSKNRARKGRYA